MAQYFIHKAGALKGTIDTINNIPKFQFISRHPHLSELEFNELLTRSFHQADNQEQITEELRAVRNKISQRAEFLGIKPNFNVQAVKELEDKLLSFKHTLMPKHFEQYQELKAEWQSRLNPLEFKLYRTLRKLKEFTRVLREHEWYERYKAYADKYALDVDDENIYRVCNRHHMSQLVKDIYGPKALVTIDSAVDTSIGFIYSEDPEIFATRH